MYNDADIEMIEAAQQANAIGAVTTTGPGLSPELVEHFTKQIGSDLFHGYADSPSYALTCWLEDEGMKATQEQFDQICWNAHGVWMRLETEHNGHSAH